MTRITCGWDGQRVWMYADRYDRRVTEVLQHDIPRYCRYWAPDHPRRRAPGRWYVMPGYAERAWDRLDDIPGVGCYWRSGPHDDARLDAAGVDSMWSAFPPGGIVPRPVAKSVTADADFVPQLLTADETDLGWPRLTMPDCGWDDADGPPVPLGWKLIECHGCATAFPISRAELAFGDDGDPEALRFCQRGCADIWLESA